MNETQMNETDICTQIDGLITPLLLYTHIESILPKVDYKQCTGLAAESKQSEGNEDDGVCMRKDDEGSKHLQWRRR